jgi:predicted DNA-binding transcriptional regulator AlpA
MLTNAIGGAEADAGIYANSAKVRRRYDISDMSLWRWLHDQELGFPQPFRINGRRFWKVAELIECLSAPRSG